MIEHIDHNTMPSVARGELFGIALDTTILLSVNAEVFSHFTDLVHQFAPADPFPDQRIVSRGMENGPVRIITGSRSVLPIKK